MSKSEDKTKNFQKIIQPIIHFDIQPVITTEIQSIIHKKIQIVIHKEIQSIIFLDIQPIIITEIQPIYSLKVQPIIFKENQTNINEVIQQLYESNDPNEKEIFDKLGDNPIKTETKIIKEKNESSLKLKDKNNNNEDFPKNKETQKLINLDKSLEKIETSEMQRLTSTIMEDKKKQISQKIIQPNVIMEEHIIKKVEIVPFIKRETRIYNQIEIVPLILKEEPPSTREKIIEQKTIKKTKYFEKYEVTPYILKKNGELVPYINIVTKLIESFYINSKMMKNIIAVNFVSLDYNIHYPIPCKKTDNFKEIENKLYQEYPELKSKKIYFLVGGGVVDKSLTFEQNKIKSGCSILIKEYDYNNK